MDILYCKGSKFGYFGKKPNQDDEIMKQLCFAGIPNAPSGCMHPTKIQN